MSQGTFSVEPLDQPQPQIRILRLYTTDSLATVSTAGYLNAQVNLGHVILPSDLVLITFTTGSALFSLSISGTGIITATPLPAFSGTEPVAPFLVPGNIQAGSSGTAGHFISYPATASTGSLSLIGVANSGNFANVISNNSTAQATSWLLPDPGVASAQIAVSPAALVSGNLISASGTLGLIVDSGIAANKTLFTSFASPDVNANIIFVQANNLTNADIIAGTTIFTPTSGKGYLLMGAVLSVSGSFSGGSNNLNLIFDAGSTDFVEATAAVIKAAANNYSLGQVGFTFVSSTNAINNSSPLKLKAQATSDYTGGIVTAYFMLQRVA